MKVWQKDPLLKVEHLTMRFGGLTAVDDVSFEAGRGDITALIGPNGAGKTTVFNCITGFYKPTEGMITLTHPGGSRFYLERLDDTFPAAAVVVASPSTTSRVPGATDRQSRAGAEPWSRFVEDR